MVNTVVGVKCGSRDLSRRWFFGESRRRARRRTAATRTRGRRTSRRISKCRSKCVSGFALLALCRRSTSSTNRRGIRESSAKSSLIASRAPSTSHGMSVVTDSSEIAISRMRANVTLSTAWFLFMKRVFYHFLFSMRRSSGSAHREKKMVECSLRTKDVYLRLFFII